jgi:hypothetical protein
MTVTARGMNPEKLEAIERGLCRRRTTATPDPHIFAGPRRDRVLEDGGEGFWNLLRHSLLRDDTTGPGIRRTAGTDFAGRMSVRRQRVLSGFPTDRTHAKPSRNSQPANAAT